ncbi:MAG: signal peptidase II [Pseudoruegeria sp.]
MRALWITAVFIFVFDQASKIIVVQGMDLKTRQAIDVWPPFINFRMAWNEGVNFGLFASSADIMRWVLIAIALVISGWVLWWIKKEDPKPLGYISAGILIGGALGNVIDRMVYGAVADFLNMTCCGFNNPYAFNVADIAIFVGVFGLIFFTGEKKPT